MNLYAWPDSCQILSASDYQLQLWIDCLEPYNPSEAEIYCNILAEIDWRNKNEPD